MGKFSVLARFRQHMRWGNGLRASSRPENAPGRHKIALFLGMFLDVFGVSDTLVAMFVTINRGFPG
jgi:hypothetical protein